VRIYAYILKMPWIILLTCCLSLALRLSFAQHLQLVLTEDVIHGFGGVPFPIQPAVKVVNLDGETQIDFSGSVAAEVYHHETATNLLVGDDVVVAILDGVAQFYGLLVNKAGDDYRIRFTLRDEFGNIVAFAVGGLFTVNVGEAYQIGIMTQPALAYGGSPFLQQPVVAIKDRGNNIVSSINEGTVIAAIGVSSLQVDLHVDDEFFQQGLTLPIKDGIVAFSGLLIDEVGYPYSLTFSLSNALDGPTIIDSDDFSVHVGSPSKLVILDEPLFAFGGESFPRQPRIAVVDAGGNMIVEDSLALAIEVNIRNNPSLGVLSRGDSYYLRRKVKNGVAQFNSLSIDKAGERYQLQYTLLQPLSSGFETSEIIITGHPFTVKIGSAYSLKVIEDTNGGLANNQQFFQQPIIAFVDRGMNIVTSYPAIAVRAFMVPSLSYNSKLMIDTSEDTIPSIVSVTFPQELVDLSGYIAGPGDVIPIYVSFSDEVIAVVDPLSPGMMMTLTLNVLSGSQTSVEATISSISVNVRLKKLLFEYRIEEGHSVNSLDYISVESLRPNDVQVLDAWGRPTNLELPDQTSLNSLIVSSNISVSDTQPAVSFVSSSIISGEYGAGQYIDIMVEFSRKVIVGGTPEVPVTVDSSIFIIDTESIGMIGDGSQFVLKYNEIRSGSIVWNATVAEVQNAISSLGIFSDNPCVSRSSSPNSTASGGYRWALRFKNLHDNLAASSLEVDYSMMVFSDLSSSKVSVTIVIVGAPFLDWSSSEDMCTTRTAVFVGGSATTALRFRYIVMPGDFSARLDVRHDASVFLPTSNDTIAFCTYDNLVGEVAADIFLNGMKLPSSANIVIDTSAPVVTSVSPSFGIFNGRYAVGDVLFFNVNFSKPVEVQNNVHLLLDVGPFSNYATYESGTNSSTLVFKFVVMAGHFTTQLEYYGINALIADCEKNACVRRMSDIPTTQAKLELPLPGSGNSISDSSFIQIDGKRPKIVNISFESGYEGRTYSTGDILPIIITFSAPVTIFGGPPVFVLITGNGEREIPYVEGNNSTALKFEYQVKLGDDTSSVSYKYHSTDTLCVSSGCLIDFDDDNANGMYQFSTNSTMEALLKVPLVGGTPESGVPIGSGLNNVVINTTNSVLTTIISATTLNEAGIYSTGDEIYVLVHFSDAVYVTGQLFLRTNLGVSNQMIPQIDGSGTEALLFQHTITSNDATPILEWVSSIDSDSALVCDPSGFSPCLLKNIFGNDVDIRFTGRGVDDVQQLSDLAAIEIVTDAPFVTSIVAEKERAPYCMSLNAQKPLVEQCSYTVGEEFDIVVEFNTPVVVDNKMKPLPYILLDNDEAGENIQALAIYDPSLSSGSRLVFTYIVEKGFFSLEKPLKHHCTFSSCQIYASQSTQVLRAALVPSIPADLTLPPSTGIGLSRDENNLIFVDTNNIPSVTGVHSNNGTYASGDIVEITVRFDEVVVVLGVPILSLEVGESIGVAHYARGSNSTDLVFAYSVEEGHNSLRLDYTDNFSLELPVNSQYETSIKMASSNPTIDANVTLPSPGLAGSLGASSKVVIDGEIPFVTSIASPQAGGKFTVGNVIYIHVSFSASVVVSGSPMLLLETGAVDRHGIFTGMVDNKTLRFRYDVQLGDMTEALDYWTSEGLERRSDLSFQMDLSSWIKRKSSNPTLNADVHLNPSFGYLDGHRLSVSESGIVQYRALKIGQRGDGYKLRFRPESGELSDRLCTATVDIQASSEYELMSNDSDREVGDSFGSSVTVDGDIIAVGTPFKRRPSPEVQILTIYNKAQSVSNEIQMITTTVDKKNAVKTEWAFSTCASDGSSIDGFFSITYFKSSSYLYAQPLIVPSNVGAEQLKILINQAWPSLSAMHVSRYPNMECSSENSWIWTLFFDDDWPFDTVFQTNGDDLVGSATVSEPENQRVSQVLRGTFALTNPLTESTTREIPYDASGTLMRDIIEADLQLDVSRISVYNTDKNDDRPELGRQWKITFLGRISADAINMDVPTLQASGRELIGYGASVSVFVVSQGCSSLGGQFALSFLNDVTAFVPFNVPSENLKHELEKLDSIDAVSITGPDSIPLDGNRLGNKWSITFESINLSYLEDSNVEPHCQADGCNLPALELLSSLVGCGTGFIIEHENGAGRTMDGRASKNSFRSGNAGIKSGSVDVFRRDTDQWKIESTLTSIDADSYDEFGRSVSLSNGYLVVGSPFKESEFQKQAGAVYLFQNLECEISHCKREWIQRKKFTAPSIHDSVSEFGWNVATGVSSNGLQQLVVIGAPGTSESAGKVFIFRGQGANWDFHQTLTSETWGMPLPNDRFGDSVKALNDTIIVSAPGARNKRGAVYIFRESSTNGFSKPFIATQVIFGEGAVPGDMFGKSIDVYENICAICAPMMRDKVATPDTSPNFVTFASTGSCFLYRRNSVESPFLLLQKLVPSNVKERDRFGMSIAMSRQRIIVGQLQNNEAEHSDFEKSNLDVAPVRIRGKAHVFVQNENDTWIEQSYLFPSTPQSYDLFGAPVAVDTNIAIVGSPNRMSNSINSGAAVVFNIKSLDFMFQQTSYSVAEGKTAQLSVHREHSDEPLLLMIRTMDRNAAQKYQNYVNELFSFREYETFSNETTPMDLLYETSAAGRDRVEGEQSQWTNGMFDYRAINDYETYNEMMLAEEGEDTVSIVVETNSDNIFEHPDETVIVQIEFLPGIFASRLGSAIAHLTIEDDGDGALGSYNKFSPSENVSRFGSAIDIDILSGMMIIGSEFSSVLDANKQLITKAGLAHIYVFENDVWEEMCTLSAGIDAREAGLFGQSVAIQKPSGRHGVTALVGAPGQAQVFVFVYDGANKSWHQESILGVQETTLTAELQFGALNSVSLSGDLAIVGCRYMEAVYIYRRIFTDGYFQWTDGFKLQSSDFDFDVYDLNFSVEHVHKQSFGTSVAVQKRTLLVGAPFADYGNRGNVNVRESFNTDGIFNAGLGKGKVYVFFSPPHIQEITLCTSEEPTAGSFQLLLSNHQGISGGFSSIVNFNATENAMKDSIEIASNIGEVEVSRAVISESCGYESIWRITFISEVDQTLPLLQVLWKNNGCSECDSFIVANSTANENIEFGVAWNQTQEEFAEMETVQSSDAATSDLFGFSIAIDGPRAIIGAIASGARPRTTWNFETGNLIGWAAMGNAFNGQPTYGDNTRFRMGYNWNSNLSSNAKRSRPQSSNILGRYFIGTFEQRPGNEFDITKPHPDYDQGNAAGDEPIGTLTSDPFLILGDYVSFYIGGGCNHLHVYVELLVDGFASMRATGKCSERMDKVTWDVRAFINRAAQIRIVDAATGQWGHINVDNFEFSWNLHKDASGGAIRQNQHFSGQHYTSQTESRNAGAAYIFRQICAQEQGFTLQSCKWEEEERLAASDKRAENFFGYSVALNDDLGLALVGSLHSSIHGFYHEALSKYPHYADLQRQFPLDESLEQYAKAGVTLAATGDNLRLLAHAADERITQNDEFMKFAGESGGAVYVFHKGSDTIEQPRWSLTEHAKIAPPDVKARDLFGSSLSISGFYVAVGATGVGGFHNDDGAAYIYNMDWVHIRFAQREYVALETDGIVTVILKLERASKRYSDVVIGYSTSDLTATGIDSTKFENCSQRKSSMCGDYEQNTGEVVFAMDSYEASFDIRIINDNCREDNMKYVQLQLHVPGGGPIMGENYRSQLRIDDDDYGLDYCVT